MRWKLYNEKSWGHKGHPDATTPNLNEMANEGVCFDNAITQNPICTPSRMCFLSGQYAHNHGGLK
jgi:arylsulfatase